MSKARESSLFIDQKLQRRRVLILPRLLREEADKQAHRDAGADFDAAHKILIKWADMESKGHLKKKEISLNANFLNDIFGTALRYPTVEHATDGKYLLERELHVPGVGNADGALGAFPTDPKAPKPVAVIELKDADTDLDTDKSNGRTAVQQLFDYLNALPDNRWGILSNFSTIRLYSKARGTQSFVEFTLQKLRDPEQFAALWCLLERGGLFAAPMTLGPRADRLLTDSGQRQKQVGNELYNYYSDQRSRLIEHLRHDHKKSLDTAIHIAQKILDRIIFVAFCEDRGFLKPDLIKRTAQVPPLFRVTNPLWRRFLDLFYLVDKGYPGSEIEHGYNGGLFAHDPQVDDLQLTDDWTNIFVGIAGYDFKDEVNVDVLGHIFERSITELEKLRVAGVFGPATAAGPSANMRKSAERKRFGIYYTPPEFTEFIVDNTIGELLRQRLTALAAQHKVPNPFEEAIPAPNAPAVPLPPPERIAAYWQEALTIVRDCKVVDPACGSGAFLIAAYELFADYYEVVTKNLIAQGVPGAAALRRDIPDFILTHNLYGMDLSEQAVEITRLALWVRALRFDKTLADLSHNIVCGNSLVDDKAVHERAQSWPATFPDVFERAQKGFDAVIGNPPWERLKLQEREFFAFAAPEIASAVSAATRRKLIEQLEKKDPELFARYRLAQSNAEKTSDHARASGRFPLTGKGDINSYMLFSELARTLVSPAGRAGLLVPSGIASDNTTKDFFADLIDSQSLIKLYDFENRLGIFPDVDGRFKFCTLIVGGSATKTISADFVFYAHSMDDLEETRRHITLSKKDIALFNPNTKTCPIFRSRKDAEITKGTYRRVRVLVDNTRTSDANPWTISFSRLFDQTNDAELFTEAKPLRDQGYKIEGNIFRKGKSAYLPFYEAKMIQAFDHRAASVIVEGDNWFRQGQKDETSPVDHAKTDFVVIPRWWGEQAVIEKALGSPLPPALLAFKNVTSPTNQRTMIAAFIPAAGVINSAPIIRFGDAIAPRLQCCLLANLNAFALDYVARQKVGNVNLNFFIIEQLPMFAPDAYADKCPWARKQTLEAWISERVLKLSCTAEDMIPLAKACSFHPPAYVWKWKDAERDQLRAELDAAFFLLYGFTERADVAYILSTFQAAGDPADPATTAARTLAAFDSLHA